MGLSYCGGIVPGMAKAPAEPFVCPTCQTRYRIGRAEIGPETAQVETVPCKTCRTPLPAKEAGFVLKYFRAFRGRRRGDFVV